MLERGMGGVKHSKARSEGVGGGYGGLTRSESTAIISRL